MIAPLYGSSIDGRYPIGIEVRPRLGRIFGLGQYDEFGGNGGGGSDFTIPDFTVPDTSFDIHANDAPPPSPDDSGLIPLPMDLPLGPAPEFQLQETLPYQEYVDAGLITPDEQIAIANGDITLEQLLGTSEDSGMVMLPTDTPAQAAAKKATGGNAAPSGGGSGGGSSGGGKPSTQQDQQLAAALAALQKQLAQAQAAGNTAQAAQLKAQIAAPGGGTSWFSQQGIIAGVPNWAILTGGGVLAFALFSGGTGYSYQAPLRRRNSHHAYRRHR